MKMSPFNEEQLPYNSPNSSDLSESYHFSLGQRTSIAEITLSKFDLHFGSGTDRLRSSVAQ
ncbi:unnamed protein product, partial [Gulo gulo]